MADFGIKDVLTTSRNPNANGICERMHQTVGNVLRTLVHAEQPRTLNDAKNTLTMRWQQRLMLFNLTYHKLQATLLELWHFTEI